VTLYESAGLAAAKTRGSGSHCVTIVGSVPGVIVAVSVTWRYPSGVQSPIVTLTTAVGHVLKHSKLPVATAGLQSGEVSHVAVTTYERPHAQGKPFKIAAVKFATQFPVASTGTMSVGPGDPPHSSTTRTLVQSGTVAVPVTLTALSGGPLAVTDVIVTWQAIRALPMNPPGRE
jgi:hypothetical protein